LTRNQSFALLSADFFELLLRQNHDGAELAEVVIESKRPLDAEPLHDHAAGAVGKAPIFVGEALKDVPGIGKSTSATSMIFAECPSMTRVPNVRARRLSPRARKIVSVSSTM
jgi:hypothetical protein